MRYIKQQKDKYDDGDNIEKDKLIKLALNKYEYMGTKDKWLANSYE